MTSIKPTPHAKIWSPQQMSSQWKRRVQQENQ